MIHRDWLLSRRAVILKMALAWSSQILGNYKKWNIPESVKDEFIQAFGIATIATIEMNVPYGYATHQSNSRKKAAFDKLIALMRDIKKRYLYVPPFTEAEIIAMKLKPKDEISTIVHELVGQATGDIKLLGEQRLGLVIRHLDGTEFDERANYGCRVYYDIFADNEPQPKYGEALRKSVFTRRKKEKFSFEPQDVKKTAYFCIRYENTKGQAVCVSDVLCRNPKII